MLLKASGRVQIKYFIYASVSSSISRIFTLRFKERGVLMTESQERYWNYVETKRNNQAQLAELIRANKVKEEQNAANLSETIRMNNLIAENNANQLAENVRSHKAQETNTRKSIDETTRSNQVNEEIKRATNFITFQRDFNSNQIDKAKVKETIRQDVISNQLSYQKYLLDAFTSSQNIQLKKRELTNQENITKINAFNNWWSNLNDSLKNAFTYIQTKDANQIKREANEIQRQSIENKLTIDNKNVELTLKQLNQNASQFREKMIADLFNGSWSNANSSLRAISGLLDYFK